MYRLHWLSRQPTPYNDFLFRSIACHPDIDLTVHFRDRVLQSHPWQSRMAQGYKTRYYHTVSGVDWRVLGRALEKKDTFFLIAGWDHPTAIILINLLGCLGKPFAVWTDTPYLSRRRNPLFGSCRSLWLQWVFGKAKAVMGTGLPGIQALKTMGAPGDKLVSFPFFLDLFAFAREIEPPSYNAVTFISSGRIKNSLKGHDLALRALALAVKRSERPFQYFIAGNGPDEQELKNLASRLGIDHGVRFLGWTEPQELRSYYLSSHVLIHPSPIHDPFPNAVLEGMAAGLAVLGSDVSGSVKDRVTHGYNGFVHPAGDTRVLAEHIEFVLRNPDKIAEMGRRARLTAEQWPVERGVSVIRKILQDAHG